VKWVLRKTMKILRDWEIIYREKKKGEMKILLTGLELLIRAAKDRKHLKLMMKTMPEHFWRSGMMAK
jgi:hypothetical protein